MVDFRLSWLKRWRAHLGSGVGASEKRVSVHEGKMIDGA